jgi:hypothetical protein
MSNDISYNLTFSAADKTMLQEIKDFLQHKKECWDLRGTKSARQLVKELGLQHPAEVVTWGFEFGKIQKGDDGSHLMQASSWANENSSNVPVSGEEGELYFLMKRFPSLSISGKFQGEYGKGLVDGCELVFVDDDESDHQWGHQTSSGKVSYSKATTKLLLKLANPENNLPDGISSKEILKALKAGADPNAWMDDEPLIYYILQDYAFGCEGNEESERAKAIHYLIDHGLRLERLTDVANLMLVMPGVPEVVQNFLKESKLIRADDLESRIVIFRLLLKKRAFDSVYTPEGRRLSHDICLPEDFFERVAASASGDSSIVEPAVSKVSYLLPKASKALRANKRLVLRALKSDPNGILGSVSPKLRDDEEVVLVAVRSCGANLRFASKRLRNDAKIVRTAIRSFGDLAHASDILRDDDKLVLQAVKVSRENLKAASKRLRRNRSIVRAAVKSDGYALQFAHRDLRADPAIVALAVANNGGALEFASKKLKADRKIVEIAIRAQVGGGQGALAHASENLQNDADLQHLADEQ